MVITTLMTKGGRSKTARHLANACFALVIPLGVVLFHFGAASFAGPDNHYLGAALAFSGGTFVCIACSDLLPELQFHSHDRFKLSSAMLLGIALAVLIGKIESASHDHGGHDHDHGKAPATEVAPAAENPK
jgi:zinc and cadmium transporter